MPVYQVTPLANAQVLTRAAHAPLDAMIRNAFAEWDRFELPGGVGWLVKYPGTAVELSNMLGITTPPAPPDPTGIGALNALAGGLAAARPRSGMQALVEREQRAPQSPPSYGLSNALAAVAATTPVSPPTEHPTALVVAIGTYYGYGPSDMWQWLQRSFSQ